MANGLKSSFLSGGMVPLPQRVLELQQPNEPSEIRYSYFSPPFPLIRYLVNYPKFQAIARNENTPWVHIRV